MRRGPSGGSVLNYGVEVGLALFQRLEEPDCAPEGFSATVNTTEEGRWFDVDAFED